MQITDVKTFLVHPGKAKNLCFVKVETDEGIHGWGECYTQADRDLQITAHVDQLKRYLVGRNPMNIKHFMQVAYDDFAGRRGAMDLYCALSGIEHAMWDITGKKLGAPVHMLLGGACRDKIRVYANGWSEGAKTPDALAEKASEVIEMGFTAMKFDPIPGPWRTYVGKEVEDADDKIPLSLSKLIMECCRDNPHERPADMRQVVSRLEVVQRIWAKQREAHRAERIGDVLSDDPNEGGPDEESQ